MVSQKIKLIALARKYIFRDAIITNDWRRCSYRKEAKRNSKLSEVSGTTKAT